MGAISLTRGKGIVASIDQELCVECGCCYRMRVCPQQAIVMTELGWPRALRQQFSDPLVPHASTGGGGRGTEEMKTNDVTGRFREGQVGLGVELGRPGIGASFRDVERVVKAVAGLGVSFEPENPVTALLTDPATGSINPEVLDERVLSAIVEFRCDLDKLPAVLTHLRNTAKDMETVFSVSVISKMLEGGTIPFEEHVQEAGVVLRPNGKINVGLGRPLFRGGADRRSSGCQR